MSKHQFFKRTAVNPQLAIQLQAMTIPAPMRGLHLDENAGMMQPGGAVVLDNWLPTLRGIKLRGGSKLWCTLPETTPVISSFEYVSGGVRRMYACNSTKVYDVTLSTPAMVASGRTSGNYVAAQLANQGGDFLTAVNDTGDYTLRFNGTTWATLSGAPSTVWANGFHYTVGALVRDATDNSNWKNTVDHTSAGTGTFAADRIAHPTYWTASTATDGLPWITGPISSTVANGHNLTYVWKYRNRLYFIEGGSMNAWYLDTNAVGGFLHLLPLSGSCTKGGSMLFGATWSLDAGDGLDDKCIFVTTEGEVVVFTGTDPSDSTNWRQEGRFAIANPMGMNAHLQVGGEMLIATIDGIVPLSQAITKDQAALQLSAVTLAIAQLWQAEVADKNDKPWTIRRWESFGGMLVTLPGNATDSSYACFAANTNTNAWCRITGWDAQCWMMLHNDLFFGTSTGKIIQANVTGYDDGLHPYTATMVGGWEMFQVPSAQVTWYQARAVFTSRPNEPFIPQISAGTDYSIEVPPAPFAGVDPGGGDFWDEGLWDTALWDAVGLAQHTPIRNTMWVSIGQTGFTHAPILQVTIAQQAAPTVELVSIAATYTRMGVNV